jgi:hypothetical protein
MRIQAANNAALAGAPSTARRASSGSFSVAESDMSRPSAAAAGLRSVSTLDALLALQSVEDMTERRKRAVAKGRNALDVLDRLKLSLLDGNVEPSTVARLKVAADGLRDPSGDSGLDGVLAEIDLRVAVELAKAGVA